MAVRLNGEELEVAEGLTFAELIEYVRGLLDHQVLVELRLDGETASQSLLEELRDRPIHGEIELFSLDAPGLVAELIKRALHYLEWLEGQRPGPEEISEGFEWLNRALVLISWRAGSPELLVQVERLLEGSRRLRQDLSGSPGRLEHLRPRLKEELGAYRTIFREIGDRL